MALLEEEGRRIQPKGKNKFVVVDFEKKLAKFP
jgi:hypothetical protein